MNIDIDLVKKLYTEDKASIRDIAEYIEASPAGVRGSLLKAGVKLRGYGEGRIGKPATWNHTLNDALVRESYDKGLSSQKIAADLGYSQAGVVLSLNRTGGMRRRSDSHNGRAVLSLGFVPTKEWLVEVMQYFTGNAAKASAHYGFRYTTFLGHLRKHGIARLPPGSRKGLPSHRKKMFDVNTAIQMSKSGLTYGEIGLQLGVHSSALIREFKSVGYSAPRGRKMENNLFRTVSSTKRKVLNEIGITACEICGENRSLDFCHIKAERDGGPISKVNCLVLCATHHRCFDNGSLTKEEFLLVKQKVRLAESELQFVYSHFKEW